MPKAFQTYTNMKCMYSLKSKLKTAFSTMRKQFQLFMSQNHKFKNKRLSEAEALVRCYLLYITNTFCKNMMPANAFFTGLQMRPNLPKTLTILLPAGMAKISLFESPFIKSKTTEYTATLINIAKIVEGVFPNFTKSNNLYEK